MLDAVQNEKIKYPAWLSQEAIGMLTGLLDRDELERFNILEIKSHPWMRKTDWAQVREDCVRDVPQEDVLALVREQRISMIEEKINNSNKMVIRNVEDISPVSWSGSDSGKQQKQAVPIFELLGFGYLNA